MIPLLQSIAALGVLGMFAFWWWAKAEHEFFRDSEPIGSYHYERRKRATLIDPILRAAWEADHADAKAGA